MVISHNIGALNAQRQFNINTKNRSKTAEKLSSGYRINRAADDAAGLAISEKMRKQVRGLSQGVENTQAGVGMCQVADGALSEVTAMLQRMTELSVQAANGTNSVSDREAIQQEINEILIEIERISDTTKFNETYIFQGEETSVSEGNSIIEAGDIPFQDFALVDLDLGNTPFNENSGAEYLNLKAIVNNKDSAAYGKDYSLIYGNGGTSSSSFRISLSSSPNTSAQQVCMNTLTPSNYQFDEASNVWSRDFEYKDTSVGYDVVIKQKVALEELNGGKEKNYVITYEFENKGSAPVDFEFMFHADTAYNNNDRCEGYYTNGQRVEKFCAYTKEDSPLVDGADESPYIMKEIPDSFSIVDVDSALAFSEKVSFTGGTRPDTISIGQYSAIPEWGYYNDNLDENVGGEANHSDLGFSLYYDLDIENAKSESITFRYGIIATETDANLKDITYKKDTDVFERIVKNDKRVWIQSGADSEDGIHLYFGNVDTQTLGIKNINLCTIEGAEKAIRSVDRALKKVSANRSQIGAQQNRLEHTIANEENIIENTTAAESRIRDTDMAEMMVTYSKQNILEQVGQSMMAQANTSKDGILSLLQ